MSSAAVLIGVKTNQKFKVCLKQSYCGSTMCKTLNHFKLFQGCIMESCLFNPIALGKAKIVYNFGLSECNRVKD